MKEVGLIGLTHILNGGVRIQYNPKLCYADGSSIDWSRIVKDENQQITIEVLFYYSTIPRE